MFDVDLPTGERIRESASYSPATGRWSPQAAGAKLGLTICYDLRFPALHRALAQGRRGGADRPSAFTRPDRRRRTGRCCCAPGRSRPAPSCSPPAQGGTHEDGRATWGHSMAVAPWGEVIALADHDEPCVAHRRARPRRGRQGARGDPGAGQRAPFAGPVVVEPGPPMIRYALVCDQATSSRAGSRASADFDDQIARGLVECPVCGSRAVRKQIMAPAVAGTKKRGEADAAARRTPAADDDGGDGPASAATSRRTSTTSATRFAREARAIHEGKSEDRGIYGEATPAEVKGLVEDGVPVAALPPEPAEEVRGQLRPVSDAAERLRALRANGRLLPPRNIVIPFGVENLA